MMDELTEITLHILKTMLFVYHEQLFHKVNETNGKLVGPY